MPKRTAAGAPTTDSHSMIAEAAYFKAQQRGFAPGYEVADWLAAERELETGKPPKPKKGAAKGKKAVASAKRMNGKK